MKLVTLNHDWLNGQEICVLVTVPYGVNGKNLKLGDNCKTDTQTGDNAFAVVNRKDTIEYRKDEIEIACLLLHGPSDAVYHPDFDPTKVTVHELNYLGNLNEQCLSVLRQYCDQMLEVEQNESAANL